MVYGAGFRYQSFLWGGLVTHSCHATLLQIYAFICQKQFENNKQLTFNCIDYIGSLPEGRNVLVARTNQSQGGCSNPTPVMLHCYKKFYLPKRQFENNKQHTYNGIDCIGRMTKWSKVMISGSSHFHVTVFQFIFLRNH